MEEKRVIDQLELRGDGDIFVIPVEAENLAEAVYKTIISCHSHGFRVETPKQKPGMTLGYDGDIIVKIRNPDSEPRIYMPAYPEDARGTMQYILEVIHGIHNHWKKDPNNPDDTSWGYTYNERFDKQFPFILARIKHDWDTKGRITGRDYQFGIWRAEEDVVLEQEDPPCLQRGQFRFVPNKNGEWVMNYITDWRSRDLFKAWNENIIGQVELMKLFRNKVSNMLEIPIKLGCYIDRSSSLHLYGLYIDRDELEDKIKKIRENPYPARTISLADYLELAPDLENIPWTGGATAYKRIIAAQSDAEAKGNGKNQPRRKLIELGYNLDTFLYPEEWDTWPKSWDREADPKILRGP